MLALNSLLKNQFKVLEFCCISSKKCGRIKKAKPLSYDPVIYLPPPYINLYVLSGLAGQLNFRLPPSENIGKKSCTAQFIRAVAKQLQSGVVASDIFIGH